MGDFFQAHPSIATLVEYAIVIIVGALTAFILYRFFDQKTLGKYAGAIIVGVIGATLGNRLFFFLQALLTDMHLNVDIAGVILGSIILVKIFHTVTPDSYK